MQRQHEAGRFVRQRRVAEVFGAQLGKAEFFFARDFPQELEVDVRRHGLGRVHQLLRAGLFKLQQHVARLDLGALAAGQFDLVCLAGLRQDGADLEVARFLKKYIHDYSVLFVVAPAPRLSTAGKNTSVTRSRP